MRISISKLLKDYNDREKEAINSYWGYIRDAIESDDEIRDIYIHRIGKIYMISSSLNMLHIRYTKYFFRGDIPYEHYKDLTLRIMDICIEKSKKWKGFLQIMLEAKIRFLAVKYNVSKKIKEQCLWSIPVDYADEINFQYEEANI